MQTNHLWITGPEAWAAFANEHPELGYQGGRQQFYNFLRYHRDQLVARDAIRLAKKKFWIAHQQRFSEAAFDLATGKLP